MVYQLISTPMSQKYALLVKGTSTDDYIPYPVIYNTSAEANAAAEALLNNNFAVLVTSPETEYTH